MKLILAAIICTCATLTLAQTTAPTQNQSDDNPANHVLRVPPGSPHPNQGTTAPATATPKPSSKPHRHALANPIPGPPIERYELEVPASCQYLAETCDLPLGPKAANAQRAFTEQRIEVPVEATDNRPAMVTYRMVEGGSNTLPVLHDKSVPYIRFTPMKLGKVEVVIGENSGKQALSVAHAFLSVKEPKEQPSHFQLDTGMVYRTNKPNRFELTLDRPNYATLAFHATYDGIANSIPIDPEFVQYRVISTSGGDVVHVDPLTGNVTPINLGHALLEMNYGGRSARACVYVIDKNHNPPPSTEEHCRDLPQ